MNEEKGYTAIDLEEPTKLEVIIEEDKPAKDQVEQDNTEEIEPDKEPARRHTRVQRLKFQRDNARARADSAESKAQELEDRLTNLEKEKRESLKVGKERLKISIDEQLTGAEKLLEDAFEKGDAKAVSGAQKRISQLVMDQKELQGMEFPEPEEKRVEPKKAHPNGIAWAKKNREWFGKDRLATAAAYALDAELTEEGLDPNDDEYYEEMESRLLSEVPRLKKYLKGTPKEVEEEVEEEKPKRPPVGATPRGPGKSTIVLTRADVDMAKKMGITLEDMARQKKAQETTSMGYVEIA